jgi:hypothetical protein
MLLNNAICLYAVQPQLVLISSYKSKKRAIGNKIDLNKWMYAVQPNLVLISSYISELRKRIKKYAVQPSGPGQNILGTKRGAQSSPKGPDQFAPVWIWHVFKPIKVYAVQAEQVSTYTHELCLSEGLIERNSHMKWTLFHENDEQSSDEICIRTMKANIAELWNEMLATSRQIGLSKN